MWPLQPLPARDHERPLALRAHTAAIAAFAAGVQSHEPDIVRALARGRPLAAVGVEIVALREGRKRQLGDDDGNHCPHEAKTEGAQHTHKQRTQEWKLQKLDTQAGTHEPSVHEPSVHCLSLIVVPPPTRAQQQPSSRATGHDYEREDRAPGWQEAAAHGVPAPTDRDAWRAYTS